MDLSIKVENSRLYIRTAAIIKSSDGYILEKENSEGYTFLVGGKLKINEHSYDGVKREIMEEISFEANDLKLLQVIENILNNREEGKEDIHEICFVYMCDDVFDGVLPETGFVKIKGEDLASSDIRPEIIKKALIDNYLIDREKQSLLKKVDMFLLVLFPLVSVGLSLFFKANFFQSILLFFGLPSLWLSIRTPSKIKKTFLFSLILSIPFGIFIDYIAILDASWYVPTTVFPFRLLGIVPVEDLVWGFFIIYSIVIFYEHFLDKGKHNLVDKRMKYLVWPLVILLLCFFMVLLTRPSLLLIPYAYFWVGTVFFLLPTVTFLSFFPRLLSKYVKTASYFFLLACLAEFTGLQLNQWTFPGQNFIGWVELFGYRFPFEEFFFLFVMGSVSILSYYEFFDDDRK